MSDLRNDNAQLLADLGSVDLDDLVLLVEMILGTDEDPYIIRVAQSEIDITYDGNTYLAENIQIPSDIREILDSQDPEMEIAFQNLRDPASPSDEAHWSAWVKAAKTNPYYDLQGKVINLTILSIRTQQVIRFLSWFIKTWSIDRNDLTLSIGSRFSSLSLQTLQPSITSVFEAYDGEGNRIPMDTFPYPITIK